MKKYRRGHKINSIDEFGFYLDLYGVVWFNDKPINKAWVENWRYGMIKRYIKYGRIFSVIKIKGKEK